VNVPRAPSAARRGRRQSGFSLVELMIALVLGLLLVAALTSIYLGSSQSYRTQGSISQVQEAGRFAHLLVVPIARQAGYLPNPQTQLDPALVFKGSNNKLAVFGIDNASGGAPTAANFPGFDPTKVVSGSDIVALAFEGKSADISSTVTNADTPLKTCLGRTVGSTQVAVNIFFVRNDDTGTPNLYCYDSLTDEQSSTSTGTSISPQPLVPGVADMQILYGIDSGNDFGANQYVPATSVSDWTRVASLQFSFTVNSIDATEGGRSGTDIATGANRGRITHSFTTVVQIRNRLHL
jgi:type IV pilus assembly protein PilW